MKTFAAIILLIALVGPLHAQESESKSKFGVSSSIQNEHTDISLAIRTTENMVVAPSVNILYVEDGGLDFGVGIAVKRYLKKDSKITPYLVGRVGAFNLKPTKGHDMVDFSIGIGMGADYFFDPNFSLGVEAQINSTFSDKNSSRYGNPGGVNVNTGSAVTATIYF